MIKQQIARTEYQGGCNCSFASSIYYLQIMNSEKLLKNIYFHYLDSSVNLIAESFIPDWVFAVSDGSGANFLS